MDRVPIGRRGSGRRAARAAERAKDPGIAVPSWYYRGADDDVGALGAELDARYILMGTVRNTDDRVRISARLVHAASGAQLWTEAYDEDLSVATMVQIQEKIARQVVETIAVPYGPIYEQELARAKRKPAEYLDTYDCVLKYYFYRRALDPELHSDAVACFRRAVQLEPGFADAWAGLALLYVDEHAFGYTPQPGAAAPLERARESARTALDIDGENDLANLALARVRFFSGDLQGFRRSADRVLALDPNNAEALALIGTLLALSGSTHDALPLVAKAIALSPRPPGLYYVAQTISELRAGRAEDALNTRRRSSPQPARWPGATMSRSDRRPDFSSCIRHSRRMRRASSASGSSSRR